MTDTTQKSGILGPDGKPVETVNIPIVKFDDFIFPMHMMEKDELVQTGEEGVRPSDIIKELRAISREMRQRFTILAAGLVCASKGGEEELTRFLNSIGLVISDINGKKFFTPEMPNQDKFADEAELNEPAKPDTPLE